jgi:Flp pilus assembly protein TadG
MVIWCLGLAVLLLPLGGLSLDLWHALAQERALQTAAADAADAGASGIDVTTYRATGQVVLDPGQATAMAQANLAQQTNLPPLSAPAQITVAAGGAHITVQLRENVHLTLLGLVEGNRPLHIAATATSSPRPSGVP